MGASYYGNKLPRKKIFLVGFAASLVLFGCSLCLRTPGSSGTGGLDVRKPKPCNIPRYPNNLTQWMMNQTAAIRKTALFSFSCPRPARVGHCDPEMSQLLYWTHKDRQLTVDESKRRPSEGLTTVPVASKPHWTQAEFGSDCYGLYGYASANDQGHVECAVRYGADPKQFFVLRAFLSVVGYAKEDVPVRTGHPAVLRCAENHRVVDVLGHNRTTISSVSWCAGPLYPCVPVSPNSCTCNWVEGKSQLLFQYNADPPRLTVEGNWAIRDISFTAGSPPTLTLFSATLADHRTSYWCRAHSSELNEAFYIVRTINVTSSRRRELNV